MTKEEKEDLQKKAKQMSNIFPFIRQTLDEIINLTDDYVINLSFINLWVGTVISINESCNWKFTSLSTSSKLLIKNIVAFQSAIREKFNEMQQTINTLSKICGGINELENNKRDNENHNSRD